MSMAWEWLGARDLWGGFGVGVFGGWTSGLLGVSSGGILVPLLALALGLDQHRAQAVSLAAQVLPTSLPGVLHYGRLGHGAPWGWIAAVAAGFAAGAYAGALGAGHVPDTALRWMFVGYLATLVAVVALRTGDDPPGRAPQAPERNVVRVSALAAVGMAGGASSGLLGIGGGLAITALLVGVMGVSQHSAQAISLGVTMLPMGLPAVWATRARIGTCLGSWLRA